MVKITDMLGAMVRAQIRAQELEAKFQAQFYGPLKLAEQVQAFLAMTPEERAAMSPDNHAPLAEHARRMQQMSGGQKVTDMGGALPPGAGG
jgi:hypothetical protein